MVSARLAANMPSRDEAISARRQVLDRTRKAWAKGQLTPIKLLNKMAAQDREARGNIWVSRVSLQAPQEDALRQRLFSVIEDLSEDKDKLDFEKCSTADVQAEWVAHRPCVEKNAPEPTLSEEAKFKELQKHVADDSPIILYVHGGGFTYVPIDFRMHKD